MMVMELDHRVKNNLAAVLSLAQQTIASAAHRGAGAFYEEFSERVRTLARLHNTLAQTHWEVFELREMVGQTLGALRGRADRSVEIGEKEMKLPARMGSSLAMTLHELASNAVRHGALSVPEGKVKVEWAQEKDERGGDQLRLRWQERDGPEVAPPRRRGFGLSLIEGSVPHELGGTAEVTWEKAGLRCELVVPLDEPVTVVPPNSDRPGAGTGGADPRPRE